MKSSELLKKIRDILMATPEFINEIPAEDIVSCVYVEFYGLRQLYNQSHFDRLEKKLLEYSSLLQQARNTNDVQLAKEILDKVISFQDTLPDTELSQKFIENANFDSAFIRHIRDNTLIVIGDSHVNFFSGNNNLSFIPIGNDVNTCIQNNDLPISVLHFGPCLAYKSNQYGSTSKFREKLDWVMNKFILDGDKILCALGEIDIRTQVFKQAAVQGRDFRLIVDDILDNYMEFLTWLKRMGHDIICWGPIASQNDEWQASDEYPRVGTVIERNMATAYFNEKLAERCSAASIGFASIFSEMVDEDMRTKREYISDDLLHLGQFAYDNAVDILRQQGAL